MASTIRTDMRICDRYIKVTANMRKDGDIDIEIESDCDAIRHFAESLKRVSIDDITNFETSTINRETVRGNMSMICLAPIAVYQAAWMEAGMLSRTIYSKTGPCTMEKECRRDHSPHSVMPLASDSTPLSKTGSAIPDSFCSR